MKSVPIILKTVLRERKIDTNSTSTEIRDKLSNLDTYIDTVGNEITELNVHAKILNQQLISRGDMSTDLRANLFKGYKTSSDQEFIQYIKNIEDNYEEGEELSPNKLINLADTKFKIPKEKGVWNDTRKEEENLITIEDALGKLNKRKTKVEVKNRNKDGKKFKGEKKQNHTGCLNVIVDFR